MIKPRKNPMPNLSRIMHIPIKWLLKFSAPPTSSIFDENSETPDSQRSLLCQIQIQLSPQARSQTSHAETEEQKIPVLVPGKVPNAEAPMPPSRNCCNAQNDLPTPCSAIAAIHILPESPTRARPNPQRELNRARHEQTGGERRALCLTKAQALPRRRQLAPVLTCNVCAPDEGKAAALGQHDDSNEREEGGIPWLESRYPRSIVVGRVGRSVGRWVGTVFEPHLPVSVFSRGMESTDRCGRD